MTGNYKEVTLMPTLYKIYASMLAEKLREKVKDNGIISRTQTGFMEGMGTIDKVYVLNYVVNKQIERRGGNWWPCL